MDLYRFDWLAQRVEEAIDPTRPIIDPHHHLWDRESGWYLAEELLADTKGSHNITATVFVECHSDYRSDGPVPLQPVGETEFVARQAATTAAHGGPEIAGIVSFADMALGGAVEDVLVAHEEAGQGRFRGIRHATSWVDDPGVRRSHSGAPSQLMSDPQFRAGVAKLGEMGYTFDAWLLHPQLLELAAMARELPTVTIVLDHLGGPLGVGRLQHRRDQVVPVWKAAMTEVAACPNVVLKVGGIGMEMYFGMGWADLAVPPSSEQVVEYWGDSVRWCIDAFGPDRCMFESNFPVDRHTLPYPVLWNSLQIIGSHYDHAEQDQLFSRTAARTYRLQVG